ncbi:RagB/SusD family nutrient uptake outer membrane protein [Ravibacter arvi]|uniref:RagB/SusD family nutrient uptake outer membrane protein n=1 Tax=Ravibacter arvi TaxID=2051041 RepID=A0ABP8M1M4_9BACT
MKRKSYIHIAGALALTLSLTSCEDLLLNPIPESVLTTTNAFSNARDIELGVFGVYSRLQSRVPTDFELMEVPSDNMFGEYFAVSPGMDAINTLDVTPTNQKINSFWQATYNGIFRANLILSKIDVPTDYTGSKKDNYMGELKFLRAYQYFDLVRIFGGVPKVTEVLGITDAQNIGRASEQEIYDFIVQDLTEAIDQLPETTVQGRASKGAAIALLAKVQVYRENWAAARTLLERLIAMNKYELLPNYRDLFQLATETNKEAIFSLAYVGGTNGHALSQLLLPNGGVKGYSNVGSRVGRPTWDLHKAFEKGDTRFDQTITDYALIWTATSDADAFWWPYFSKWRVPAEVSTSSGIDIPLLRYADMLLLYSEVLFKLGEKDKALVELNKVRARAFKSADKNYVAADVATDKAFMDKLLLERRLELAVENNRWFDLVRTGRFVEVLQTIEGEYNPSTGKAVPVVRNAQPFMKYFPIPWEQIQLANKNVLTQNEGY